MDEYPFFSATIARDGSVIVSKTHENTKGYDYLLDPETLYLIIQEMIESDMVSTSRDQNILTIRIP